MPSRRDVLQLSALAAASMMLPLRAFGADAIATRTIPSSGEALPVIGTGTNA